MPMNSEMYSISGTKIKMDFSMLWKCTMLLLIHSLDYAQSNNIKLIYNLKPRMISHTQLMVIKWTYSSNYSG